MSLIPKVRALVIILSVLMTAAAILSAGSAWAESDRFSGTFWNVHSIDGKVILPGTVVTVYFGSDGELGGSAGCNRYSTQYKTLGNRIVVDDIAVMHKVCKNPEGIMEQEKLFIDALQNTWVWRMGRGGLELMKADESRKLILYPAHIEKNSRPLHVTQKKRPYRVLF